MRFIVASFSWLVCLLLGDGVISLVDLEERSDCSTGLDYIITENVEGEGVAEVVLLVVACRLFV